MKGKRHIRRILFLAVWLTVGAGIMVLLVAAFKERKGDVCRGYEIHIRGAGEKKFIDKQYIVGLLPSAETIKGKPIKQFDLKSIEQRLENSQWVRNAELFFDNNQVMQIRIEEQVPIARIFTADGYSYYITRNGERLALSSGYSARLPVFTNFPAATTKMSRADSLLLLEVERVSDYLLQNPLWMGQIAQIDITRNRQFEMIPAVGNHIIEFGDAADCEDKFKRLLLFYQQVLGKRGLDVYKRIRLQYKGQVVGVWGSE